jgi:hypothetical protein
MEQAGDWLNPILVKETRQALKSRQFIVTFLLMLIGAWMISVFGTLTAGDSLEFGSAGRGFFILYFDVLALAIFAVIPYTAYRSLLNERDQTTLELLSITTLTPRQLVLGKLSSAMVQVFIYYSAIAPFIAFTSLLQGFDLAQVSFILTASLLVTLCLTMLALMLAAVPQNRHAQGGMTLMVFGGMVWLILMVLFGLPVMLMEPIAFDEPGFWYLVGCAVVFGLSFFYLFQQIATAQLTFESDNRSTGIRLACSLQFVLFWAAVFVVHVWVAPGGFGIRPDEVAAMAAVCGAHCCIVGFFTATEADFVSRRVRRGYPRSVLRLLAIPFLPGGHRGFLYLLLHLGALAFIVLGVLGLRTGSAFDVNDWVLTMVFYIVAYLGIGSAFGRWLRRFSPEVRPMHTRVITLIMFSLGVIVPVLPSAFGMRKYQEAFDTLKVTNPFSTLSGLSHSGDWTPRSGTFTVVSIAAALAVLLNLKAMFVGAAEVLRQPVLATQPGTPQEDKSVSTVETSSVPERDSQ